MQYSKGDIINLYGTRTGLVLNNGIGGHTFFIQHIGQKIEYIQYSLLTTRSIMVDHSWVYDSGWNPEIYYELIIGDVKGWVSLRNLHEYDYDYDV